jgi:hypothetical protein
MLSHSIEQDRLVHPAGPSLFLVCRLHHPEAACTSMSTILPSKALYCTCNVRVVSRKPFQGSLKPTRPKESCMRCAVSCSATLARKLRSLANELPAIKPSSGTKASTTPCNLHSCHTKEVYLCAPSPPSGTFTCRRLSVRPPLLLDKYGIVAYCKQDQHRCATDDESPYPRTRSTHVDASRFDFHDYSQNMAQHTDAERLQISTVKQTPNTPSRYPGPPAPIMYIKQGTSHAGCQSISPSHGITCSTWSSPGQSG